MVVEQPALWSRHTCLHDQPVAEGRPGHDPLELRSPAEVAESRAAELARLRAELADQTVRRIRAEGERDRLEAQHSRQLQMLLDTPGQTLEDITHEFNNILSVVSGFGELLQSRLAEDPDGLAMIGEIVAAAASAGRLLCFIQPIPRVEGWKCDRR